MKLYSPLHRHHAEAGARFLDWGGWQLPAAYTSVEAEVRLVRTRAGFTEFPFLSHLIVSGTGALAGLQTVCSRDLAACPPGQGLYTLMLDGGGGVAEDGMVFRLDAERFLVTVPGPNPARLPAGTGFFGVREPKPWLAGIRGAGLSVHPLGVTVISVQGPQTGAMLRPVADVPSLPLRAIRALTVGGVPVLCARTGFSGEAGVEFIVWPEYAAALWDTLADLGRAVGAAPYGIGAAMILGLEKGYVNANDFYPGATPVELGLDWLVARRKADLTGAGILRQRRQEGARTRLVGIEMADGGPVPRTGQALTAAGAPVGRITNGGYSPTLGKPIARGWVPAALAVAGTAVEIDDGQARSPARIAGGYRWYDPDNRRLHL